MKYPPWIIVDVVERYLDDLYDFCVEQSICLASRDRQTFGPVSQMQRNRQMKKGPRKPGNRRQNMKRWVRKRTWAKWKKTHARSQRCRKKRKKSAPCDRETDFSLPEDATRMDEDGPVEHAEPALGDETIKKDSRFDVGTRDSEGKSDVSEERRTEWCGLRGSSRFREIEAEIVVAINAARQDPHLFIPLVSTKTTQEGASLVEETKEFLRNAKEITGPLCLNPSLSETCAEAILSLGRDSVRHTASLSKFVHSLGFCAGVFGEMFWFSGAAPQSGLDVVIDFLLDDGVPSRSHRTGIFDSDFHEIGVHVTRTNNWETVAFVHFADRLRVGSPSSSRVREIGKPKLPRRTESRNSLDSGRPTLKGKGTNEETESTHIGMKREPEESENVGTFIDLTSSPERMSPPKTPRIEEENGLLTSRNPETRGSVRETVSLRGEAATDGASHHSHPQTPLEATSRFDRDKEADDVQSLRGVPTGVGVPEEMGPETVLHDEATADSAVFDTNIVAEGAGRPLECGLMPRTEAPTCPPDSLPKEKCPERKEASRKGRAMEARGVSPPMENPTASGENLRDPSVLVKGIQEKQRVWKTDQKCRQEGIHSALLTSEEEALVRCLPSFFGVTIEEVSNAILITDASEERWAYRGIMELFQTAHDFKIRASSVMEACRTLGPQSDAVLDRLLDAGEMSDLGDDFELLCPLASPFPWQGHTQRIPPPALKSSGQSAPVFPPAAMEDSIPQIIPLGENLPELVTPLKMFSSRRRGIAKQDVLFQWLRSVQPDIRNSTKLMAEILWLFFDAEDEDSRCILFSEIRGWMVYDGVWMRDEPRFLRATQLLQGPFHDCIVAVLRTNRRRNLWRSTERNRHPRVEFLLDLQRKLGNHTSVQHLLGEARPYFLRSVGFDLDPMILQLQNAVVDLRRNFVRESRASDYTSKMSQIRAPIGAFGPEGSREETSADSDARKWTWDLLWSIFRKDETNKYHVLDQEDTLGEQDAANFKYLLLLLARLLEGRPLKKVVYVFSPRGRNSKRSIEELLRQLLGEYMASCKHSIFSPEKAADESNSSVSLSREGVRVLFGQEIDRKQKWSNAILKRRADCGREGGTLKHSNVFHEYDPVYTPFFGCNEPFLLETPPGNSEQDRTLILYLPNKFCDDSELEEEPRSPRRFPKAELDTMLKDPRSGWGLLLILLHLRRSTPDLERIVNEGTPTSSFWKQEWFPKTGLLFQQQCFYRNQFASVDMEEAITQYRAWRAAAPLATYEFQTLPKKEIRSILLRTFGDSSVDGSQECIRGWSIRPWNFRAAINEYSRVGMKKEQMAGASGIPRGRKEDGTFDGIKSEERKTTYSSLPSTPRQLVKFWQQRGILQKKIDGGDLELRTTSKYGDKLNRNLALCRTDSHDKHGHYGYKTIRPRLLWYSKIPLVEVNRVLYDLSWDLSNAQIATKRGWMKFTDKGKIISNQPISHLRRLLHKVIAYTEEKRFQSILLGGPGKEVETDAGKLGRNQKNGIGHRSHNKAYVQFLGERGGEVLFHVFAHPEGGVERLSHVKEVLDGKLGTGTLLHTDRARAYLAYVMDNPGLKLYHCRVNHSEADKEGFSWNLYMDADDGEVFGNTPEGYTTVSVSTQKADGMLGKLKSWLHGKGGVARKDIWRFVKEYQWRANWSKRRDLYDYFLECFAETEKDLREGRVSVAELDACVEWDFSSYQCGNEVDEYDPVGAEPKAAGRWICPGCGKTIAGRHLAQYKFYHKKTCRYYEKEDSKTYDHESSRCLCCVHPEKGVKRRFSEFFSDERRFDCNRG